MYNRKGILERKWLCRSRRYRFVCHKKRCLETPVTQSSTGRVRHLLFTAGFLGLGALLHYLPATKNSFKIISSDWKDWTKIALGVSAVGRFNQAMDLKLPPWLVAIETAFVINPLVSGLSKKALLQTVVMAPLIAGVVQGANYLNNHLVEPLKEKAHIPPVLTRLGVTIGVMLIGVKAYPGLYKQVASTGVLGNEAKSKTAQVIIGTEALICGRCGGSHLICMSEIGDYLGGMLNWLKSRSAQERRV